MVAPQFGHFTFSAISCTSFLIYNGARQGNYADRTPRVALMQERHWNRFGEGMRSARISTAILFTPWAASRNARWWPRNLLEFHGLPHQWNKRTGPALPSARCAPGGKHPAGIKTRSSHEQRKAHGRLETSPGAPLAGRGTKVTTRVKTAPEGVGVKASHTAPEPESIISRRSSSASGECAFLARSVNKYARATQVLRVPSFVIAITSPNQGAPFSASPEH